MPDPLPGETDFSQQRRTFRLELLRSLPQGFVETAGTTYSVFVAIRIFGLPDWMKGSIIASGSVGLLLSLFLVQLVRRIGCTVNRLVMVAWAVAAAGFGLAAASSGHPRFYFASVCLAHVSAFSAAPLMAQIYRKHYPDERRGHLFSLAGMSRAVFAALAGWAAGLWVEDRGHAPLFATYAATMLLMAGCVGAMAPVRLRRANRIRWFDAFRHVGENAPFRKLLVVWMLLGLGNLTGWALFVEFISNPRYGFGYSAGKVGLVTSTIPMIAFIACAVPWGIIFDRMPFYRVRMLVNLFFLAGILVYYLGGSFAALCTGIALHGIAQSGGNVLWTLWTTRFAPADRVMEYQSVHSFLTGLRGVLAPLIAFAAAAALGPSTVALIAGALLVAGTVIIAPEILDEFRRGRLNRAP